MKIIDLSKPIYNDMEVYPGDPEVKVEVVHTYEKDTWLLRRLSLGSHTGTHVDAFSHMDETGKTLDLIPLERFFGKAFIVGKDEPFQSEVGLIFREPVDIEFLNKIISANPPFVGGHISESLERNLLKSGIVTFTNLVNLEQLPTDKPFMFYGFPLKIKDGDGSPVRAVAIIE